ncbi:MAG TPA: hypothetical protein VD770_03305 [Coxiellaceae bacterium]|nr:hypothetical protein [Coxiellaceae bacterium]
MRTLREELSTIGESIRFFLGNVLPNTPWAAARIERGRKLVTENPFGSAKFKEGYDDLADFLENERYGTSTRAYILGTFETVTAPRINSIMIHLRNKEFEEAQCEAADYLKVLPNSETVQSLQRLAKKGLAEVSGISQAPRR